MAKISTLTDGFATIDTGIWTAGGVGPVTATGGVLKLEYDTAAFAIGLLQTNTTYDLTSDRMFVQIADPGTQQSGWTAGLRATGAGTNNAARMYVSDNGVVAQISNAGSVVFDSGTGVAFNAAVHKWMQIRETAGVIYFETSSNGANWTTLYSVATSVAAWSLTTIKADMFAQRGTAQATGGYTSFDNFNIAAQTPQGNFFRFFGGYNRGIGGNPGLPDPPPPVTGSAYIETMADIDFAFAPTPVNTPNAVIQEITAPSGAPGFQMICSDDEIAPWNVTSRAVLAKKQYAYDPTGTTEDWTWDIYMPTQSLSNDWQAGVLWEWHTAASSGHHFALNSDGTFRIVRMISQGQNYDFVGPGSNGPPNLWNQWQPIRFKFKWSLGGDGRMEVWVNGTKYLDYTGATLFSGEGFPALQFGFYAIRPRGLINTVRFANIQRTVT